MQESTTYQKILREGRDEGLKEGRITEAQRLLLLLGEIRFGVPEGRITEAQRLLLFWRDSLRSSRGEDP